MLSNGDFQLYEKYIYIYIYLYKVTSMISTCSVVGYVYKFIDTNSFNFSILFFVNSYIWVSVSKIPNQ